MDNEKTLPKGHIVFAVGILCILNICNYMDRVSIMATSETHLKNSFCLNDKQIGWIFPAFIIPYMFSSFLAGYLGDRYNRKWVIAGGSLIWMLSVIAGSFVSSSDIRPSPELPSDRVNATVSAQLGSRYLAFILSRFGLGVGDACLVTVAPTIIHDLVSNNARRLQMLTMFNVAIPVGAALGIFLGSYGPQLAATHFGATNDLWQWSLRATSPVALATWVIFVLFMPHVPRGYSDRIKRRLGEIGDSGEEISFQGTIVEKSRERDLQKTIKGILKNKTFRSSTLGCTCLWFVCGGCTSWMLPLYIRANNVWEGQSRMGENITDTSGGRYCGFKPQADSSQPQLIFSLLLGSSGIVGPVLVMTIASRWNRLTADCDLCSYSGYIGGACFFVLFKLGADQSLKLLTLVAAFSAMCMVNVNFTLGLKVILEIVDPREKSIAVGMFITMAHMLGDALSPLLIGFMSDTLAATNQDLQANDGFKALQYAMYILVPASILGGVFFTRASRTYPNDVYTSEKSMCEANAPLEVKCCENMPIKK